MTASPFTTCSLQTIHLMDSTLDDDESYYFLIEYQNKKILHEVYKYPHNCSLEDISILTNNFTFFCARVLDIKTNQKYTTNFPIGIFRFMLHADMSWSPYYTVRRKPGYVVEGAYWSNGMFYQVREDKKEEFIVHEVTLMIDSFTQRMHHFPESAQSE